MSIFLISIQAGVLIAVITINCAFTIRVGIIRDGVAANFNLGFRLGAWRCIVWGERAFHVLFQPMP